MSGFLKRAWDKPFIRKRILPALCACAVLATSVILFIHEYDNFHVVVDGKVYRSAQLSGKEFEHYIDAYNLKSVLNLRGRNKKHAWWRDEIAACERKGVEHIDFRMSARRELTDMQWEDLRETIEKAPKPLLIHCAGGADRSGLASAMCLKLEGASYEDAKRQLGVQYGHLPFFFNQTKAMDATLLKLHGKE